MTGACLDVYLCRHARTALNAAGLLRGRLDPPLDEVGEAEARGLAVRLDSVPAVRVVSSPLSRARRTADLIAVRQGRKTIIDPRLTDRDYGEFAGRPSSTLREQFGTVDAAPGVEPAESVVARALRVLDRQLDFAGAGPVVMVSHDIVIRLLLVSVDPALGDPDAIAQHTACWNLLRHDPAGWHVLAIDQRTPAADRDFSRGG